MGSERRAAALVDSWRLDDLPVDLDILKSDIARVISDAVAAERERCARVARDRAAHYDANCPRDCRCADGWHIAAAIVEGA